MTDKAISPLRQRMIEDMTARHFAEKVQKDYIRYVKNFTAFLGRSPETATSEDLRLFQLHMTRNHVSPASINCAIVALRFFFKVTLERDDLVRRLTFVREPRKAPIVLSPEEVARLLEAAPGVKYKAALSVAYGAGLRVSEVVALKVFDIDSQRMTLRVEQGKGDKDRYVMLSPQLSCCATGGGWRAHGPGCSLGSTGPAAQSRLSRRGADGGNRQARVAAYVAP